MADKQKFIKFRGVSDVVYAKVLTDTSADITFGEVKHLAWVAELSNETETSASTDYADNQPVYTHNSEGADTITINSSALTDEVLADISGKEYDAENEAFYGTEREQNYFALGYRFKEVGPDGTIEKLQWFYKGSFGVPSMTVKSEDDSSDTEGQEITYTAIMPTKKFTTPSGKQKAMKFFRVTNKDNDKCNTFFDKVTTPDDFNNNATE